MESQVSLGVMRKEISIRFFQLKVSEFLTTRPHGHVDSWTFFSVKTCIVVQKFTNGFLFFILREDGWFLPSSVTFYIIAHIAIQCRGVAWTSYIHIKQTNKYCHTVLVYGPPRELNKDWATPWFVFFRSLVPILFNEPFSTLLYFSPPSPKTATPPSPEPPPNNFNLFVEIVNEWLKIDKEWFL